MYDTLNTNEAVEIFYDSILNIIKSHCSEQLLYTPKYFTWFGDSLKQLTLKKKKVAHKIFKQTSFSVNYNSFSKLRTQ